MAIKSLSIRIEEEMRHRLHVMADYEARSGNSQIIYLIRKCIEEYEERYGKIEIAAKRNSRRRAIDNSDILC